MKLKLIIPLVLFFLSFESNAQMLKNLSAPPNFPVVCATMDTLDNLYTLVFNDLDSSSIYRFNGGDSLWRLHKKVPEYAAFSNYRKAFNVLYGKLYISAFGAFNDNSSPLYEVTQISTNLLANVKLNSATRNTARINSVATSKKIYYYGDIDSFGIYATPQIIEFNGSSFNPITPPTYNKQSVLYTSDDTLYVTTGNKIYTYINNTWSTWSTIGSRFKTAVSIVKTGAVIFACDNMGIGYKLFRNNILDSFVTYYPKSILTQTNNKVHLSNVNGFGFPQVYSINDKLISTEFNFRSVSEDSFPLNPVASYGRFYVFNRQKIKVAGINYGYLAEVITDSLKAVGLDSIYCSVFRDINKNNQIDLADSQISAQVFNAVEGRTYQMLNFGYGMFTVPNNEPINVSTGTYFYNGKCYKVPFSGGLSSRATNDARSRDTLKIPLWQDNASDDNLSIAAVGLPQVRLDKEASLRVNVSSSRCNGSVAVAKIMVELDSGMQFMAASSAPDSTVGRKMFFNIVNFSGVTTVLDVIYKCPFSKFSAGQNTRINVRLLANNDTFVNDNVDSLIQKLVYSYDPNIKTCVPTGRITYNLKKIKYSIQFQNEGTDDAWRVRVVDTLNLDMPVVSFKVLGASHPYQTSHIDNIITWTFDNIYLKPKSVNEAASVGYINFEAWVIGNLGVGDSITNKASIYFDFNDPIETNACVVKRVKDSNNLPNIKTESDLIIYPNPAGNEVSIYNLKGSIEQPIKIYDIKGALLCTLNIKQGGKEVIDISNWSQGIYVVVGPNGLAELIIKQ
ncbi:MAG TPA: T9SS type A sorting domain-containing protein [Bacteroidia bacterium]